MFVKLGKDVKAHHTVRSYGKNSIGDHSILMDNVILGSPSTKLLLKLSQDDLNLEHADYKGCSIGHNAIIRSDTVVYCDTRIGDYVRTGHKVLIRENVVIGHNVLIGTNSVIDSDCSIGNYVNIQSLAYIPTGTIIEDYTFLGPCVTFTNDRYPVRIKGKLSAPRVCEGASIGGNAVVLPGVVVGKGAFVAAGAIVTKNVPDWHMAVGAPAEATPLPKELRVMNDII